MILLCGSCASDGPPLRRLYESGDRTQLPCWPSPGHDPKVASMNWLRTGFLLRLLTVQLCMFWWKLVSPVNPRIQG
jgi:hypothetical protein